MRKRKQLIVRRILTLEYGAVVLELEGGLSLVVERTSDDKTSSAGYSRVDYPKGWPNVHTLRVDEVEPAADGEVYGPTIAF